MEQLFQYLVTGLAPLAAQAAPLLEQEALSMIESELKAVLAHIQAAQKPKGAAPRELKEVKGVGPNPDFHESVDDISGGFVDMTAAAQKPKA